MTIRAIALVLLSTCSLACSGPTVWLDGELDAGGATDEGDGEAATDAGPTDATTEPPTDAALALDASASDDEPEDEGDELQGEACSSDLDCSQGEDYRCDTAAGRCVECLDAIDCDDGEETLCDPEGMRCVECLSAADCAGGVPCDPIEHECEF